MLPCATGSAVKTNAPTGVLTTRVTTGSSVMSFTISNEMSSMAHIEILWANGTVISMSHGQVRLHDLAVGEGHDEGGHMPTSAAESWV